MKIKKQFTLLVLMAIFAVSALQITVHASGGDLEADYKAERPALRVAVSVDYPAALDRLMYVVLSDIGYDMVIDSQEMMSAIEIVNNGDANILELQLKGIDKKYKNLVMVPEPMGQIGYNVYARTEENRTIGSWDDFLGQSVGVLYEKPYIMEQLPVNMRNVIYKRNHLQLITGLSEGEYDYVVTPVLYGSSIWTPENVSLISCIDLSDAYLYVNNNYKAIIPQLNAAIKKLKQDGTSEKILNNELFPKSTDKSYIMHITSYSQDTAWVQDFREGLKDTADSDQIEFQWISLNSFNFSDDTSRASIVADMIRSEYYSVMPEVVVVSDDGALEFIRENYYTMFYPIPVAVLGISECPPEKIFGFTDFFTGLIEQYPARETVDYALKLFPKTDNIFVINDYTDSGSKMKELIAQQLEPLADSVKLTYSRDCSAADLLNDISNLPPNSIVLCGKYYIDSTGRHFSEKDIQTLFFEASRFPIFGLISTSFGYGQIGGKYVDVYGEGQKAGSIVKTLLEDQELKAGPILPDSVSFYGWMFDRIVLDKYGIKKSQLPTIFEGYKLINPKQNFFSQHPRESQMLIGVAILMLVVLSVTSWFLIMMGKRNRDLAQAQKNLHSLEELLEKDKEIALVRSRLEQTIDSSPIGFTRSVNSVCVESNAYAKNVAEVYPGLDLTAVYVDPNVRRGKIESLQKQDALLNQLVEIKVNNETKRFYVSYTVADEKDRSNTFSWFLDVEEKEQHKDDLKTGQEELQKLIDIIPSPIAIFDQYGTEIFYENKDMISFWEQEKQGDNENILLRFTMVTDVDDVDIPKETLLDSLEQGFGHASQTISEWVYKTLSGQPITVRTIIQPIKYHGKNALIMLLQDIDAERHKVLMLYNAAQQESVANALKSKFLINMSHQIRTPMNAIVGLAEIELRKSHSKEIDDVFKKISISSKNLLTIIDDILDFTKIEAEELNIFVEEIELEEVVSGALLMATQRVGSKMVEILLKIEPDVPNRIYADQTRLWQILKNLLDNSAKYTQRGKIELHVSRIGGNDGTALLSFVVSDTGYGMKQEQIDRLFIPFEQFHNRRDMQVGTGIGMTITKQLIDLMNGNIEVQSVEGQGTTITITIPFRLPPQSIRLDETFANVRISKNKILIVDDEPVSVEIMSGLLRTLKIVPVSASSGEEAIKIAKEYKDRNEYFNIVIIDYLMKGKNGIDTAKQLKNILGNNHTKLLMVSAYAKQLVLAEIMSAGFDDVIEKPFCPTDFIRKLCDAVEAPLEQNNDSVIFDNAKVLLCEDNLTNQEVASGILEMFGIVPVIANNGLEGLNLLDEQKFDLVLMDILMPVMDGHEATRTIRSSDKPYKDIPIIALTANVMRDEIDRCMEDGMNAHVGKPISIERLQLRLMEWLPKEKQRITNDTAAQAGSSSYKMQALRAIDGLDATDGLLRLSGNEDRYLRILLSFAERYMFKAYNEALSNPDELKRYLHDVKGVAGNLGINSVYLAASQYESEHSEENYNTLVNAYKKVSAQLSKILQD